MEVKILFRGEEIATGILIEGRTYTRVADLLQALGYDYTWEPGAPNRLIIAAPEARNGCGLGNDINDIQITANFNLREFACPHCGAVKIDPVHVWKLQVLRDRIGRPIIITSGYRCPAHNKAVGGVEDSQHLLGKATDIKVTGMTPQELAEHAEAVGFTGIGIYKTFVHVDSRPGKARWQG